LPNSFQSYNLIPLKQTFCGLYFKGSFAVFNTLFQMQVTFFAYFESLIIRFLQKMDGGKIKFPVHLGIKKGVQCKFFLQQKRPINMA